MGLLHRQASCWQLVLPEYPRGSIQIGRERLGSLLFPLLYGADRQSLRPFAEDRTFLAL
jgi:hypothetical protein